MQFARELDAGDVIEDRTVVTRPANDSEKVFEAG